jgi:hypothetical protein
MTSLLYISHDRKLTDHEKSLIDKQVYENRKKICKVPRSIILKAKKRVGQTTIGVFISGAIYFFNVPSAQAMGLSPRPITVYIQQKYNDIATIKYSQDVGLKPNKVTWIEPQKLPLCVYFFDEKLLKPCGSINIRNLNKLRGGGFLKTAAILITLIFMSRIISSGIDSFVYPTAGLNRPNPFQPVGSNLKYPPSSIRDIFFPRKTQPSSSSTLVRLKKPTDMPQEAYSSLTRGQKKALLNSEFDMAIKYEGKPELLVGFNQASEKVYKHGAVHGVPNSLKPDGTTKSQRTDENTLQMMKSVVNMPYRKNIKWFLDGTYQKDTPRGFRAIHIYDLDTRVVAVFRQVNGIFVTTFQLSVDEELELMSTNNCGGDINNISGKGKNLPLQTVVNTFNNNSTAISPINQTDGDLFLPFIPRHSFENDVLKMTPKNE